MNKFIEDKHVKDLNEKPPHTGRKQLFDVFLFVSCKNIKIRRDRGRTCSKTITQHKQRDS